MARHVQENVKTSGAILNGSYLDHSGLASAPPVSNAGECRLYFDQVSNKLRISENAGPYVDVAKDPVYGAIYVANASDSYTVSPGVYWVVRSATAAVAEAFNTAGIQSGQAGNGRVWIGPQVAGKYRFSFNVSAGIQSGNDFSVGPAVRNGATPTNNSAYWVGKGYVAMTGQGTGNPTGVSGDVILDLAAGDRVAIMARNDAGSSSFNVVAIYLSLQKID